MAPELVCIRVLVDNVGNLIKDINTNLFESLFAFWMLTQCPESLNDKVFYFHCICDFKLINFCPCLEGLQHGGRIVVVPTALFNLLLLIAQFQVHQ